ncbi:2'-5' RNA ligase family protein [Clostridium sp. CM028]|uniref:2'-5' RNA ligase family protein n=1 Tax=unclassified Clostridium TaxID=2614128 RepID=UPI001C0C44F2|nr:MULTISPECIES: 2'-5' RNA ligase family protein [unclassified Clostridium]MBU3091071.1 2'-5' RNA ligase family protein [Clostridium sp. CF011]MBW9144948.1 2'-5' RNA ligase family protein [Clostridium sp. CM027]MBW9148633.1 2'-5' RNA ligase family protein [Clostridium sp. CM028]UVE40086.1 2'-5' RNA ligase family protein [Clostridium sp. CM027]WAG69011.1 2'-5' RNA ligase family protein [Clostridium sp. CF011]
MIYYLVGLFDKVSYKYIESMQKAICEKYNLYKSDANLPMLHVTLEIITNPNLYDLDTALKNILKNYTKFEVELNGVICFDPPYKSVNLNIGNEGTIYQLSKDINSILNLHGFKVRDDIETWNLHISLANTTFADREWSNSEYLAACASAKDENFSRTITVDTVELWKPINNNDEMVTKKYIL